MGFKRREFTATLKAGILDLLGEGASPSKAELLARLRPRPELRASVRRLTLALGRLIAEGKIEQTGARGSARFRRAPASRGE